MVARVMILAGGTGGHIFPALAVCEVFRSQGCEVRWMGTQAGMESRLVPKAGIPMDSLAISGFRGKGLLSQMQTPFKLVVACWQAFRILKRYKPNVVLGMGGFVAGPGGMMAKVLSIPLVIHEQNRIPGTTNRLLVKWSRRVLEAFPGSFSAKAHAIWVGNPLRRAIVDTMAEERPQRKQVENLLIVGGSLGAKALNEAVPHALAKLGIKLRIRHQTGETMHAVTKTLYDSLGIEAEVVAFIQNMAESYQWADLVVCRAGAVTLSELAAAALPSILVPFPYAIDDHQTANARYISDAGAAVLLPQNQLTPQQLAQQLRKIIQSEECISKMSAASLSLAMPDAARKVAEICLIEAGK